MHAKPPTPASHAGGLGAAVAGVTFGADRLTDNAGTPRHRSLWHWYLALALTGAGVFFVPAVGPTVGWGLVYVALCGLSLAAILLGVRRNRPARPLGWYLLAAAYGVLVIGNGVWYP